MPDAVRAFVGNFKGPKGEQGPQGIQGPTGPQGIQGPAGPSNADGIDTVDTLGVLVSAGESTDLQRLIDAIADKVMTKLLAKTDIVQTESTATNKVPSSAYLKQVKDSIDSNLPKIIECGNTTFTKINANTYADINITFTKVFDSAPSIQLTDGSKSESVKYGSMSPSAINITSKGFTIRYYNNTDYTPAPYVMWTAIL